MTYAVQQDLVDRFGDAELKQLTDRVNGTTIDATVVAAALADAGAEIDSYLVQRYALPLSATPDVLKRVACEIARYRLYANQSGAASETVRNNYKDAVAWLRDVAAGRANLDPNASAAVPASTGGPQYKAQDRVFSAKTLNDY
jgi:phage gp36-like protein